MSAQGREDILDRLQGILYPYHTGDQNCKCEQGCNYGNRGNVKNALLSFIEEYGSSRELEGRIDENNTAFLRIFKIGRTQGLSAKLLISYHDKREKEIKGQLEPQKEKTNE